jgi:ribosomal protein S18 acetylase RimI-like enzyme
MTVEVRKARRDSDFRQLYNLFVEYEADLPRELRHGTVPEVTDLKATYKRRNAAFLATSEGDPAGCVALTELDSDTAVVMRLFVKPESRRLGAARCLVAAAIGFAREGRFHRVVLDTNKERLGPAYRLYRSLGFEECAPHCSVTYESPTFMELVL